jgi:hypothetical protein
MRYGICHLCGKAGKLVARNMHHACYNKARAAGLLDQYPPQRWPQPRPAPLGRQGRAR